jgi:hypothetical protein
MCVLGIWCLGDGVTLTELAGYSYYSVFIKTGVSFLGQLYRGNYMYFVSNFSMRVNSDIINDESPTGILTQRPLR